MAIIKRKKEDPEARYVKGLIIDQLLKEGHKTFANWLANPKLYLRLTDSPDIVAAISEKTNEVFLNNYFTDIKAISMLMRHELLHRMFKHESKTMKILAKQLGIDYDTLDDLTLDQLRQLAYAPTEFGGSLQNIVGDYHLSQYYTNLDREYVKNLDFYGQSIKGLLIDDLKGDNLYDVNIDPNKVDKYSFEELYDLFDQSYNRLMYAAAKHTFGNLNDTGEFVEEQPDHDLYLGVEDNSITLATDEKALAKKYFNSVDTLYHTFIPDYMMDQIKNNEIDLYGLSLEDFEKEYNDFTLEEVDNNLSPVGGNN